MSFSELFKRLRIDPGNDGHGEYARLFPALSEKGKEGRAASIFLACLANIPEFAHELLNPLGRPIGKRSSLVALTEVQFPGATGDRPDGLIAVRTGNNFWTCLVEFKVGGILETDQVERYLRLAKSNSIEAVLTISNDIVPAPDVSPVQVDGRLTRSVGLFHVSWKQILAHLQLLVANDGIADSDHLMIVREFIRFLNHSSTGIKGFDQMPSEWAEIVDACRDRKLLRKNGDQERSVVEGWIQEERELSFKFSEQTGSFARVIRKNAEKASHSAIVDNHLSNLIERGMLSTKIQIEGAAAPVHIELDLRSRSTRYYMELGAPRDKTQAKACVTWLTRQLDLDDPDGIDIEAIWPGRRQTTHAPLGVLKDDPYSIVEDRKAGLPTRFRVIMKQELQRTFSSRKGVISSVEAGAKEFYRRIGQNITAWIAPPPKSRERTTAQEIVDEATIGAPPEEEL